MREKTKTQSLFFNFYRKIYLQTFHLIGNQGCEFELELEKTWSFCQTQTWTRDSKFCGTRIWTQIRKYLKQVQVNFHFYNIITTEFNKNKIFLLEIKDLMQKVGLSQAFSKIFLAQLKSSILYAERSFCVKHGLTNCLSQPFISHHCRWLKSRLVYTMRQNPCYCIALAKFGQ